MRIKKIINQTLSYVGVVLVSKKTFECLSDSKPEQASEALIEIPEIKNNQLLLQHQINAKWSIVDYIEAQQPVISVRSCQLCDFEGEAKTFNKFVSTCMFEGGKLVRHQCPQCDAIFGPDKMLNLTEDELSSDYKWHYRTFSEGDSTDSEVRAFKALNPKKDGIYLNWGAGSWSKTIELLRIEGWNVYGFEPHGAIPATNLFVISNKEQLSKMKFDGIFSNNVLEHFRHPVSELSAMRELLKPNGKMSHATPCYEYLYEFTRFHLFFYLGRSRELIAKKSLLRIDDFIVDGHFMNIIFSKA